MVIEPNFTRIDWDYSELRRQSATYPPSRVHIPPHLFQKYQQLWVEIGSGTGRFFIELSERYPEVLFVPIERSRFRGKRLLRRANRIQIGQIQLSKCKF